MTSKPQPHPAQQILIPGRAKAVAVHRRHDLIVW